MSYLDIEDRGFNREEIWYNRERSEQLFWQVMDEAGDQESFDIEGPLWIQVQAMEKGLEITVTKAQLSKDGQNLDLSNETSGIDDHLNDKLESLLDLQLGKATKKTKGKTKDEEFTRMVHHTVAFNDFEDMIQLSHRMDTEEGITSELYHYKDEYILIVKFDDTILNDHVQDDVNFESIKNGIIKELENKFPNKSSFEL